MKNDKLICSDGAAWLKCYEENNNCDEKSLIYRYTQYVSKVAPYLEQECSQAVHWLNLLLIADFDNNRVVMVEKKDIL